jgi:hypothetical protein
MLISLILDRYSYQRMLLNIHYRSRFTGSTNYWTKNYQRMLLNMYYRSRFTTWYLTKNSQLFSQLCLSLHPANGIGRIYFRFRTRTTPLKGSTSKANTVSAAFIEIIDNILWDGQCWPSTKTAEAILIPPASFKPPNFDLTRLCDKEGVAGIQHPWKDSLQGSNYNELRKYMYDITGVIWLEQRNSPEAAFRPHSPPDRRNATFHIHVRVRLFSPGAVVLIYQSGRCCSGRSSFLDTTPMPSSVLLERGRNGEFKHFAFQIF